MAECPYLIVPEDGRSREECGAVRVLQLYSSVAWNWCHVEPKKCPAYTLRARADELAAENARLIEERTRLTERGITISEKVCGTCQKHMLAYGRGLICPECNARGREDDLRKNVTLQRRAAELVGENARLWSRLRGEHPYLMILCPITTNPTSADCAKCPAGASLPSDCVWYLRDRLFKVESALRLAMVGCLKIKDAGCKMCSESVDCRVCTYADAHRCPIHDAYAAHEARVKEA